MKKITISIEPEKLIRVTENHGGFKTGICIVCGASGWLWPGWLESLKHKEDCPVGEFFKRESDE